MPTKSTNSLKETTPRHKGSPFSRSWAILIALLGFALYVNTLGHDYTVDDGTVMENNTIVKKGISAWPEIFSTRYRAGFWERKENMYRPLSLVMFAAEWQLAPGNPFPGHLMNVLLYVLTTLLVYRLCCRLMKGSQLVPALAALLFAAHPLHTEVVANIKSRDEILGMLFAVAALLALLRYHDRGKTLALVLSAGFFLAAMLSKENAITMLVVAPLTLYFFTPFSRRRSWSGVIVFAAVTGVYLAIRAGVLGGLGSETELQLVNNSLLAAESGLDRFATALGIMGRYMWLLVFPHPLVFDYSYSQIPVITLSHPQAFIPGLAIIALLVYAIRRLPSKEPLAWCVLFFAATLSLVSNFVFLIESTMAERFLYMPSLAFSLAAAILLDRLFRAGRTKTPFSSPGAVIRKAPGLAAVMAGLIVLYSVKSIGRNAHWKDNLTLLENDVKLSPESARIRYAYGSAILIEQALEEEDQVRKAGLLDKAIAQLEKGVSILDTYADAFNHLGIAYKEKGDFQRAVDNFEAARRSKSFNKPEFFVSLGISYGSLGQYGKAIAELEQAVRIDPESFDAWNNLGIYYTDNNQPVKAVEVLEKAHRLRPDNEKPLYNMGNAYARSGEYRTAIEKYNEALALDPGYEDALNNIGNSYAATKDYRNAIVYYQKVVTLNPGNRQALNNLGVTFSLTGDQASAQRYFQMVAALDGK